MDSRSIWQPWHETRRLQREIDQLFGDLAPASRWPLTGNYPPMNVVRTDGGVTVDALCPGVDRDTFDITLVGDALTLRCERKPPADLPQDRCHRRERPLGGFTRTISMGERFDPDHTQAKYTNGILRVELTPAAESSTKKIPIQS